MTSAVLALIFVYKKTVSPLLGMHCRFYPTCADYAFQAVEKYGAAKGAFLGLKRLLRCHPFREGGLDPVP